MALLVIAEHDNTSLKAATLNAVTAATRLGGDIHVLVAGANAAAVAAAASKVAGVSKVLLAEAPQYADQLAENLATLVIATVQAGGYSHVLAPATASAKNFLPLERGHLKDAFILIDTMQEALGQHHQAGRFA